ncbi:ABC transporter permease [Streptomyces sp. SID2888]|uniref:ABC transporter permease n=1 Tax=Streptomyces sp. SID2888 TaxID=2690256 RepID=UPI0031F68F3D
MTTAQLMEREERTRPGTPAPPDPPRPRLTWQRLTVLPLALVVALLATLLWFRHTRLDPDAEDALARLRVSRVLWQHIELTALATLLVAAVTLPLGVLLTRGVLRRFTPAASTLAELGRTAPVLALPALPALRPGTDRTTVLTGLVVCAALPVLSSTVAGLVAQGPAFREAARDLGMSPLSRLTRVELPLAVPLILAGARTALVLNAGTATLAVLGGRRGLGALITTGATHRCVPALLLGSVLTAAVALLADWLASVAEALLRPRAATGI